MRSAEAGDVVSSAPEKNLRISCLSLGVACLAKETSGLQGNNRGCYEGYLELITSGEPLTVTSLDFSNDAGKCFSKGMLGFFVL